MSDTKMTKTFVYTIQATANALDTESLHVSGINKALLALREAGCIAGITNVYLTDATARRVADENKIITTQDLDLYDGDPTP